MRTSPGSNWLAMGALALAACSGACASSGAVPRPFPVPAGTAAPAAPGGASGSPAPAPSDPSAPSRRPNRENSEHPEHPEHPANPANPANRTLDGYALAGTALGLRGAPYRNGGTDPNGFDCSGFTQFVFAQYGLSLPRAVREQYRMGTPVNAHELAPGDMIFFSTTEPGPSHVAIAIGGDQFVHAPSSSGVVRVEHLTSTYWSPRYVGARRLAN